MSSTTKPEYPALMLKGSDGFGRQYWILDKPEITLGRDETCDIVIDDRQISRQHLRFLQAPNNRTIIEDLNSKNGTWVNGNRLVGSTELSEGDEIHVALVVMLKFVADGSTLQMHEELPDKIPSANRGRLHIDLEARRVFVLGEELDPPLSLPQYRLLELLFINTGRVCTRDEVVETVWPEAMGEGVSEQAIDALVRRLRDRLAETDPEWQYVVTMRGHGFRLEQG